MLPHTLVKLVAASTIFVFAAATVALAAENKAATPATPEAPEFAMGWRVTGVVRQGDHVEASLEHTNRRARFVREGEEISPGVVVEKIDAIARTVTLRQGQDLAVIHPGPSPLAAITKGNAKRGSQPAAPQPSPWAGGAPPAAGQDSEGRWGIRFSNGGFYSAQDYANRFGGVEQAVEHARQRLANETDPHRRAFHEQMLSALSNVNAPSPLANPAAVPGSTTAPPAFPAPQAPQGAGPAPQPEQQQPQPLPAQPGQVTGRNY